MGKVVSLGVLIILLTTIGVAGAVSVENLKKLNIAETDLWDPVLSPDGTKIAYVAYDDSHNQQVFTINIDGTGEKKLTNDAIKKWGISWGQDKIAYISLGNGGLEKIFIINPDGTDNKQLINDNSRQGNSATDSPPVWAAPSWSPDGKSLLYTSLDEKTNPKIYIVNSDGTGKRPILNDTFRQWSPAFSPDGKNIVYVSYNDRFKEELFITDTQGAARRQLTFDEIKKNYPFWGPGGTITYVSYENVSSSGEKIFTINQDGTDKRLFVNTDYKQRSPSFSLNGRKFAYAAIDSSGIVKISIGDVAGITSTATSEATTTAVTAIHTETTASTTQVVPKAMRSILWIVLIILGVIVVILLVLLATSNVFSKK